MEFWGRVSAHHLQYGGRTCLIAGVADISDLRDAQAATLAASDAKSQLLSNVGHVMRTPLTDIIGYADLLIESAADPVDPPALVVEAGRIRESGLTLLGMINALLDHSALETGTIEMRIEPVELTPLVAEVRTVVRPMLARRGNHLTVPEFPALRVLADRTRLKQALLYLVSHADSSVASSEIGLFIKPAAQGGLELMVRDTGAGMTPEALARALQPFDATLGRVAPALGDLGLNLAISRGLCERMGGVFTADATPGRGYASRCGCHWPLRRTRPPSPTTRKETDMTKILLVEDNELNRDMLSRRLIRRGYEVVMAVDGAQALAAVAREKPDLILMDMSLPTMDGWEATRRLKADIESRTIPVIALTAHAMSGDRERALDAGCDEFDTKPIEFDRLVGKMEGLL